MPVALSVTTPHTRLILNTYRNKVSMIGTMTCHCCKLCRILLSKNKFVMLMNIKGHDPESCGKCVSC